MKTFLKIIFLICFILEIQINVNAQSVIWRQIIGEQYNEIGYNCIELRDGGYLMAGFKEILVPGTSFIIPKSYLIRLDHYGNILWEKIIGDSVSSNTSVTVIEDSLGNIYLPYSSDFAHIVKMDYMGNTLWDKEYSFHNISIFRGMSFENNFKNIVLLSENEVQGIFTSSVSKIDSNGNMIWNKAYYDSIPIITGYTSHNNSFLFLKNAYYISGRKGNNGFIIKIDTSGKSIWIKRYPDNRGIFSIAQNSENTFVASCQADAAGYLYCQKFDSSGNIEWSRNYINDSLASAIGYDKIIKTYDNNFAIGTTHGYNFGRLLIIDPMGSIMLSRHYYYPQNFSIGQNNINKTIDSGYIVGGSLDSNNTYYSEIIDTIQPYQGQKRIDALIFKIDKYGNTVSIKNNYISSNVDFDFNVYPNPYNLSFNINLNLIRKSFVKISLYDISGRILRTIKNLSLNEGEYNFNVSTPELSSSIYFLKVDINKTPYSKKILLIK